MGWLSGDYAVGWDGMGGEDVRHAWAGCCGGICWHGLPEHRERGTGAACVSLDIVIITQNTQLSQFRTRTNTISLN